MFQTPFSEQVRNEARVATMCVGNITTADQANTIVASGRADLVALGRPHLSDPSFVLRSAAWYGVDLMQPVQYGPGKDQLMRNTPRERQDLEAEAESQAEPACAEPVMPPGGVGRRRNIRRPQGCLIRYPHAARARKGLSDVPLASGPRAPPPLSRP